LGNDHPAAALRHIDLGSNRVRLGDDVGALAFGNPAFTPV
jgi:hypothetical protein